MTLGQHQTGHPQVLDQINIVPVLNNVLGASTHTSTNAPSQAARVPFPYEHARIANLQRS